MALEGVSAYRFYSCTYLCEELLPELSVPYLSGPTEPG